MSWHRKPLTLTAPITSRFRFRTFGGTAARQALTRTRKPTRLTLAIAALTVVSAVLAAGLVAIWPASASIQLTAAATRTASTQPAPLAELTPAATRQAGWLLVQKSAAIIGTESGQRPVISPAAVARDVTPAATASAALRQAAAPNQGTAGDEAAAGTVVASAAASGSPQQIALAMLPEFGWSTDQFDCLDALWNAESGWNPYASNPGSGAYGIPQALPGSKMASAGPDWQTNPATQISWGLSYIQATYGSPCAAWDHEQADGWY